MHSADRVLAGAARRRALKRHQQQELVFRQHGGKRKGAGRPPKGNHAGSPHAKRPRLKGRFPVHVVLRTERVVGSLRKRLIYRALREATIAVAMRELNAKSDGAFRIVHVSVQRTHVHLIVEADSKTALSRGMQSFQISAAKHINREVSVRLAKRRRGKVFTDRFHAEIIESPRQARHALAYVLNNWRKHEEDRSGRARTWKVDPFSTGVLFDGWREREAEYLLWRWPEAYEPLVVYYPKTWLLREGWRTHGTISFGEVPSAPKVRATAS